MRSTRAEGWYKQYWEHKIVIRHVKIVKVSVLSPHFVDIALCKNTKTLPATRNMVNVEFSKMRKFPRKLILG